MMFVTKAFHATLRSATQADHKAVDAAFARFDLGTRDGYVAFLTAHARALLPLEAALTAAGETDFRPRAPLLRADLAALPVATPDPLPFAPPQSEAARAGMLYVGEGSRLGGAMLVRGVPAGLPTAYLSAVHLSGEWRTLLDRLDRQAAGEDWMAEAIDAARSVFALYARAADS